MKNKISRKSIYNKNASDKITLFRNSYLEKTYLKKGYLSSTLEFFKKSEKYKMQQVKNRIYTVDYKKHQKKKKNRKMKTLLFKSQNLTAKIQKKKCYKIRDNKKHFIFSDAQSAVKKARIF